MRTTDSRSTPRLARGRTAPTLVLGVCLLSAACASSEATPEWARPDHPAPSLVAGAAGRPSDAAPRESADTSAARTQAAPRGAESEREGRDGPRGSEGAGSLPREDEPRLAPNLPASTLSTAADASPGEAASGDATSDARAQADPPVAWVAGTPVSAGALLSEWYWNASREMWLVFDKLVAMRLATLEAQRVGLRIAPETVELRVAEENRRLAGEVAALGEDLSVEQFLRTRHGFDPEVYFRHLRDSTIRQLIAERAVRAWTLSNEWARLRLIVVADEARLETVRSELEAGAEFADLAREHSLDDTSDAGGLVPFLVHQEHSPLARIAFSAPLGEVAGPLEVSGHHALILVTERHAPLAGAWGDVGSKVEETLAEFPLTDAEFLHWKIEMEKRYPVDVAPLEALLQR